jgi:D-cysteine desulfhydrase
MRSLLLLRVDDPDAPPPPAGNILLDRLAGADIRWISRADWQRRGELMAAEADRLRGGGRSAYVICEGGSDEVGAWGYVGCAGELAADLAGLPRKPTAIVHACGSGGTTAGLALGTHLAGLREQDARPVAINVCDDHDYFVRTIDRICGAFTDRYELAAGAGAGDVDIVDGHVGRGYSLTRPEELATLRDLARREGIVLDPVYSGKAFHGMVTELARDRRRFGDRIVFVHTGGLFGLLPRWAELAELL